MSSSQFAEFTQPGQKPVVNSIFDFSAEALGQLRLWLEQNPPAIGITSILGFTQFTAQTTDFTPGSPLETTASVAFVDLATVGPTISNLADGQYVVQFGCSAKTNTAGQAGLMAIQANSVAIADDVLSCQSATVDGHTSIARAYSITLKNAGNNTLTAKYRASGGTASFQRRWMTVLKYANA